MDNFVLMEDQGKLADGGEDFKILMTVNKEKGERALQMRSFPSFNLVYEVPVIEFLCFFFFFSFCPITFFPAAQSLQPSA